MTFPETVPVGTNPVLIAAALMVVVIAVASVVAAVYLIFSAPRDQHEGTRRGKEDPPGTK